ncbi:MAG: alpha-galactosidase [Pseudomonadota bacterium]
MVNRPFVSDGVLRLDAAETTLLIGIGGVVPVLMYWGRTLPQDTPLEGAEQAAQRPVYHNSVDQDVPLTLLPQPGLGFFGQPALEGSRNGLDSVTDIELFDVITSNDGVVFKLADGVARLWADIELKLDAGTGVLAQRVSIGNDGDLPFDLGWCAAAAWAMPWRAREALTFEGRWSREFQERRVPLSLGRYVRENRKGRTSHDTFPGIIVGSQGISETKGEIWGCHLGWSGNHRLLAETLSDGGSQVQLGELLAPGEVRLEPGGSYTTPWAYGAYSDEGLNGLSHRFHRFVADTLIDWPGGAMKPRPVIVNTWEAVYFSHDLDRLAALADRAAAVGAERFVLDDGWFGGESAGRDDDTSSLGDWQIDHRKWPQGLHPLIDHVRSLGMEFGLWVEPEMISPSSDLYRTHPDWALHVPDRRRPTARNQLVLDLTIPAAFDHVWTAMDNLLRSHDIAYLKWDMNRDLAPIASAGVPVQSAQTKAVYALIERLRADHPAVEIESCASGGSRADYGALARTHRIWTSDCNDAHERQRIQRGAARFLPLCVLGCHIGPDPAHTTGGSDRLDFRAVTAMFGHMGLELNLLELEEGELDEIARVIAVHKGHRDLLHSGRYVRLEDDLEPGRMGQGMVSRDRSEAIYAVAQLDTPPLTTSPPVRLIGLARDRSYAVRFALPVPSGARAETPLLDAMASADGVTLPGAILSSVGLQLPTLWPRSAVLLHLTVVD